MVSAARTAYAAILWVFLASLVIQVYLAGAGLFKATGDMSLHVEFGYWISLVPVLALIAALVGRIGRPTIWWVLLLAVLSFVQPIIATLREAGYPWLAALHPVNAVVLVLLTIWLAIGARMARQMEAMS